MKTNTGILLSTLMFVVICCIGCDSRGGTETISSGRDQAVQLDRQGAALLRDAAKSFADGRKEDAYDKWRQAISVYERVIEMDPAVAANGKVIVGCISVDLAQNLGSESNEKERQESIQLAEKAIPLLEAGVSSGVMKCEDYLRRARQIAGAGVDHADTPGRSAIPEAVKTSSASSSATTSVSNASTLGERDRLTKYNQWGSDLKSNNPERMRNTLRDMQDAGFGSSKWNTEDFEKLREKYGQ